MLYRTLVTGHNLVRLGQSQTVHLARVLWLDHDACQEDFCAFMFSHYQSWLPRAKSYLIRRSVHKGQFMTQGNMAFSLSGIYATLLYLVALSLILWCSKYFIWCVFITLERVERRLKNFRVRSDWGWVPYHDDHTLTDHMALVVPPNCISMNRIKDPSSLIKDPLHSKTHLICASPPFTVENSAYPPKQQTLCA